MKHFSFVILHYQAIEDTIECIESILKNVKYDKKDLVVVDNGSPDGSGEILVEKYANNNSVHILLSPENLGFAKGNNMGFQFAKNSLKTDFVAMINNDTVIKQEEFITETLKYYDEKPFAVLGPDIVSLVDQGHQNPVQVKPMDKRGAKIALTINRICLWTSYVHADEYAFKAIKYVYKIKDLLRGSGNKVTKVRNYETEVENVQLHGSALIFSPKYIQLHNGLYPETFMYLEEDILYYLMKKEKQRLIYYPKVQIFHKEDSSTKTSFNSNVLRRRFKYKNHIDSLYIFLKLMNSEEIVF
jgi:GT2 family glycosyltransferase